MEVVIYNLPNSKKTPNNQGLKINSEILKWLRYKVIFIETFYNKAFHRFITKPKPKNTGF